MDILDERVFEGFGIKPRYIRKLKYMYIIRTDKGVFVIRKTDADKERILFCDDIKNGLRRKGYRYFDMFERAVDGEPYFQLDGTNYIMTASGRETLNPDYSSSYDFREIIKAFAGFHRAAVFGESSEFEKFLGEDIYERFRSEMKSLERTRRMVYRKRRPEDIDYIFLKNYDYYMELCARSLEGLEKYGFEDERLRARREGRIIINDADEETMVMYPTGVRMTELLKLSVASPIEDLRLIIDRYLKKRTDSGGVGAGEIIKEYAEKNDISDRQIKLLYYMLLFPERYIKTYCDYYKKGHIFTPVYVKDSVGRIISRKEGNLLYISELIK